MCMYIYVCVDVYMCVLNIDIQTAYAFECVWILMIKENRV